MASFDTIVALCKRRGFVYPTSEIYGGLANSYDYGPYGAELMRNIRNLWWKTFIQERADMVGLDSQIIQHPTTWVASGHVGSFSDPLVEDKKNHKRYRADHLIEAWVEKQRAESKEQRAKFEKFVVEDLKLAEMGQFIKDNNIKSPDDNDITEPKPFDLLFETQIGTVAGEKSVVYLRGETAQGIFANFKQIVDSSRVRLPFGVGQIGKSFRNEVTQGQFVFRTFELEQAEIEYFFDPEKTKWQDVMDDLKKDMWRFAHEVLGIKEENLRWRRHTDKERSHYSTDTYDLDYNFPFGFKELWGIAYRSDYDLKQHMKHSGKSLEWVDSATGRKFVPHVVEPAVGVNRLFLMILNDAYEEEDLGEGKKRTVLHIKPSVAPVKAAVFPLQKDDTLRKIAKDIFAELSKEMMVEFDDAGNIGKMYRRQDEIGTPFCITVDYESAKDNSVTVRDRDTMKQERVKISDIKKYISDRIR
ncbi:MAG: glycine--tRNA ligase [Patescibacteria group bacterium]